VSDEQEELLKQLKTEDVLLQTVVTLLNLSAHKLDHKDPAEAKKGIDAARAMLPLCPEEQVGPIKQALSQLQMAYVQATQPEQKPKPDIWTPGGNQ
jgi:hypothetical protein